MANLLISEDGVVREMTDAEQAAHLASLPTKTEVVAENLRRDRDSALRDSDVYTLNDFPLTDSQKTELLTYRQALRDISKQADFPNVDLPTKPNFI
tara:strand:- start:517 stop:804 length:288 start_codon:yes stop_codon:yes gene_type:complete